MSNKIYDILKWVAQILLPAIGTLYFALASIWGFPYGEQVVGSITAIDTFLGVCLGISNYTYSKTNDSSPVGTLMIDNSDPDGITLTQIAFDKQISDVQDQDTITLSVDNNASLQETLLNDDDVKAE
jgi:hypothetical protein